MIVVDTHQAKTVRTVRTPIVVRSKADVSIIVRLLFVIPADRVAAAFRGRLVEEDPWEVTPGCLNAGRGSAGTRRDAVADGHYFAAGPNGDGLWFVAVDDLYSLGAPGGEGGP